MADAYSAKLTLNPEGLISALEKATRTNTSKNTDRSLLHLMFVPMSKEDHTFHPPLDERIDALKSISIIKSEKTKVKTKTNLKNYFKISITGLLIFLLGIPLISWFFTPPFIVFKGHASYHSDDWEMKLTVFDDGNHPDCEIIAYCINRIGNPEVVDTAYIPKGETSAVVKFDRWCGDYLIVCKLKYDNPIEWLSEAFSPIFWETY